MSNMELVLNMLAETATTEISKSKRPEGLDQNKRVAREGVYLERGSLTEQGRTWFTYRGQEIEYYNNNLGSRLD